MNLFHIVGARPNFMKVAPVLNALKGRENVVQTLVHTGQHYDVNMSDVFFQQLDIPAPDVNLAVGSGSHAMQTAEIIFAIFESSRRGARIDFPLTARDAGIVSLLKDRNVTVAGGR